MKTTSHSLNGQTELMFPETIGLSEQPSQSGCDARRAHRVGKRTRVAIASLEAPALDLFSVDLPPSLELAPTAPAPKPLKVHSVSRVPYFNTGVENVINAEPDLTATLSTPSQAISSIEKNKPDVIVFDGGEPKDIHLAISIIHRWPGTPLVLHSTRDGDDTFLRRILRAGAMGYVKKENSQYEFPRAIREVIRGHMVLPEPLRSTKILEAAGQKPPQQTPIDALSDCELVVFYYIGKGIGTSQIAEELTLSVKTVESHRAHIKEKLHLATASQLVRAGVRWVSTLS